MDEFEDDFDLFDDDAADYAVIEEEENESAQSSKKDIGCLGILILLSVIICVFVWVI